MVWCGRYCRLWPHLDSGCVSLDWERRFCIASVCVSVRLIVSFLVTCLRETSYREFEGIHQTINYPLHPLHGDRGASHGHLRPVNIFFLAPSHLAGTAPQCYITRWDDWGREEGKKRRRNVTSTELFKLKDVQCLTIERSTKQCHSAFPRRDSKHSSALSWEQDNKCAHAQGVGHSILNYSVNIVLIFRIILCTVTLFSHTFTSVVKPI